VRVFQSRVLRRLFETKRYEVMGCWSKLHNVELHKLYTSPMMKSRKMIWAGHVARIGKKKNAWRILVEKPEGERPLRKQRHRWVKVIKTDRREVMMVWVGLMWLRIGTSGGLL
jgi:hypothetical protein